MAYEISYFFDRTGLSPESLLDAAAEWLRGSGLDASVGDVRRGSDWDLALDWIAADLRISAESTGISIEIHRDDSITGEAWREASAAEGAPVRDDVTGLCVLTLSGEVHDGANPRTA